MVVLSMSGTFRTSATRTAEVMMMVVVKVSAYRKCLWCWYWSNILANIWQLHSSATAFTTIVMSRPTCPQSSTSLFPIFRCVPHPLYHDVATWSPAPLLYGGVFTLSVIFCVALRRLLSKKLMNCKHLTQLN